ncbi:hypothetical protein [Brachybacterium sp. GPGPB12]|uniref:hypothetical protein n=1 Tax=Brachybacterium sp. GPGPB12 TaxID=3023517 RepID=UPI0031345022
MLAAHAAADRPADGSAAPAEVVATARGVRHGYRSVAGDLSTVLDDLDLDLRAGSAWRWSAPTAPARPR